MRLRMDILTGQSGRVFVQHCVTLFDVFTKARHGMPHSIKVAKRRYAAALRFSGKIADVLIASLWTVYVVIWSSNLTKASICQIYLQINRDVRGLADAE